MLAKELDIDPFLSGNRIDFNIPITFQDEDQVETRPTRQKITTIYEVK